MTYKPQNLPEVQAGQRALARAEQALRKVDKLNEEFFADKPYGLELNAGFCEGCAYGVTLTKTYENGSGFSFDIVETDLDGLMVQIALIEDRLIDGVLGKFIVRKLDNDAKRANFKYAILEGN